MYWTAYLLIIFAKAPSRIFERNLNAPWNESHGKIFQNKWFCRYSITLDIKQSVMFGSYFTVSHSLILRPIWVIHLKKVLKLVNGNVAQILWNILFSTGDHAYVILCMIWYHLYNLKNVKNTHGGMLLLLKVTLIYGCF